jgi:hypothetical protein
MIKEISAPNKASKYKNDTIDIGLINTNISYRV